MSSKLPDRFFKWIIKSEGKTFTDDANDPGGATRYGIAAKHVSASSRGWDEKFIREDLTEELAREVYEKDYYLQPRVDDMPQWMGILVFDAAVQHGGGRAVKMLQKVLTVQQDGRVGETTLSAIHSGDVYCKMGNIGEYLLTRAKFYGQLPHAKHYMNGWMNRLQEVMWMSVEMLGEYERE